LDADNPDVAVVAEGEFEDADFAPLRANMGRSVKFNDAAEIKEGDNETGLNASLSPNNAKGILKASTKDPNIVQGNNVQQNVRRISQSTKTHPSEQPKLQIDTSANDADGTPDAEGDSPTFGG